MFKPHNVLREVLVTVSWSVEQLHAMRSSPAPLARPLSPLPGHVCLHHSLSIVRQHHHALRSMAVQTISQLASARRQSMQPVGNPCSQYILQYILHMQLPPSHPATRSPTWMEGKFMPLRRSKPTSASAHSTPSFLHVVLM